MGDVLFYLTPDGKKADAELWEEVLGESVADESGLFDDEPDGEPDDPIHADLNAYRLRMAMLLDWGVSTSVGGTSVGGRAARPLTPEDRSEIARRAWVTRHANAAAREAGTRARKEPAAPRAETGKRFPAPDTSRVGANVLDFNTPAARDAHEAMAESARALLGRPALDVAKVMIANVDERFAVSISGSANQMFMDFNGVGGTSITRVFRKEQGKLTVYHSYFTIPEANQGKGIATDLLRGSFSMYEDLGVDRVTALANINVGGYAWARFGFLPTKEDAAGLYMLAADKIKGERGAAPLYRELIAESRKGPNARPELAWKLADSPFGKLAMKGLDWHASFDMHDKKQLDRLSKYLNRKRT